MTAYLAAHPYASATELAEVRAAERGQDPPQVPYFDLTVSAVKSVSVLHASYRVSARQARDRGEDDQAAAFDARADELEDALMDSAREAVSWLDRHAAYTRTGHHSARTGEWRDGGGLVASLFLHHLSRDGDPQLHVHVAIWNRVQRADGADDKWRTLDSRSLHGQRLGVAPVADRILETRLSALGYAMVPRADGNGAEIGGVSQDVMDLFSSRAVAVTGEARTPRAGVPGRHGKPPSRRTLWLLHQQAGQNTRRTKAQARRTLAGQTGAPSPPRRSGSPPGKPRPCTANCTPCPRCTRRSPGSPPARADVHRRCWMMRPSAPPPGSRSPKCRSITRSGRWRSSASRCTGRSRCCPRRRRRGGGHRGRQAGRLRPGRDRRHPGHRPGHHRRDRPGRPRVGRRQHLPAAERRTVLHAGPPGRRRADPRGRQTDRAAARHPGRRGRPSERRD